MSVALRNIGCLATCRAGADASDAALIANAALVWDGEIILWCGPDRDFPEQFAHARVIDCGGRLVIPGLVDCHTHVGFAGWRADEFAERMAGTSYLDIAKRGGGILSTVQKTRAIEESELATRTEGFLNSMLQLGVTTVECKSGYGLNLETELKQLQVYRALSSRQPQTLVSTLLAAHTIPPEFLKRREDYIELVCEQIIPAAASANLARFCDVFVEETAFTISEARRIFAAAKVHGLRPKLHADQFHDSGGALLAAEVAAISADHLEHTSAAGIEALRRNGVVAVALPLCALYTRARQIDARKFVDAGVRLAVATDFNPGSAPSYHLPLAMLLSCTLCGLTPAEALRAATINAAYAVEEHKRRGSIEPGKLADVVIIDSAEVNDWLYHFRPSAVHAVYKQGERVWGQ